MLSLNTFRVILVTLALTVGSYALASSLAGWAALDRPAFPSTPGKIVSPKAGEVPGWLPTRNETPSRSRPRLSTRPVR